MVIASDQTDGPSGFKLLRALRLVRMLRLLRLFKIQAYINTIEESMNINLQILNVGKVIAGIIYLTHILGCGWFYIHLTVARAYFGEPAAHAADEGDGPITWLSTYDGGSGVDAAVWVQYVYSVYWALTTLSTVRWRAARPRVCLCPRACGRGALSGCARARGAGRLRRHHPFEF